MTVSRQKIHEDGPEFSRLAWGAWRLESDPDAADPAKLADKLEALIELGITTIDHADIYGGYACEAIFGAALKARPGLKSRIELVTKAGVALVKPARPNHVVKHYNTSKAHLVASCERSLTNLGVDAVDLYLIHRPDPLMDADEAAEALTKLRDDGKIKSAGVSNFTPFQFDLLQSRLSFPLVTNQVEHSVLHLAPLHDGTFDHCQQHRVSPMVWSPLGRAALFGETGERHERLRKVLEEIAGQTDAADIAQVALAFILRHPSRPVPVLGSGKFERLQSMARADTIALDRQQWFRIWEASNGAPVP
ncbi:aldo/keto reductase [Stappia sp. F7233]|uniref:Aldo/keto reductase n=1 Tax=Stappia albiluteola TaxID=2758565 RepID=A0A839A8E6_9HYPH|nr:aldo/keto reductase [Stappia albiluteola]MBA5775803.1 aldo/keto reductase [Stappia albiluteola]